MSALGLVEAGPTPEPVFPSATPYRVELCDTLSAGKRLWIRGRFLVPPVEPVAPATQRHWWQRRASRDPAADTHPLVHIETRVSGQILEADVPVDGEGAFEALGSADLPPARRGWRVARNKLTLAGHSVEACNLVVQPPSDASAAIIVILPLELTVEARAAMRLSHAPWAAGLPALIAKLQKTGAPRPVYYLACEPGEMAGRQIELGLAAAGLGWPAGQFLVLAPEADGATAALNRGLERLRWLLAGALDLVIVNLEPSATALPVELREPVENWAVVRRLLTTGTGGIALPECVEAPGNGQRVTVRPTRSALVPRYPVVFCHGMLASSMLKMQMPAHLNCFSSLETFLAGRGLRVLFPQVLPTGGVVERATSLKEQVERWSDGPLNLVAHSMGGLDARYLITHLGMARRVRSLTTISAPHRGTFAADWFIANFRSRLPLLLALETLGVNVDGFRDCRLDACRDFNAKTPDAPEVRYFSYAGEISPARLSPFLRRSYTVLTPVEGPNDGMVSSMSARWGEFLGIVHADHFAQTPDAAFTRPGEDFDALGFYSRLIEDLARRGF
jgi:triacylglycerol lipase